MSAFANLVVGTSGSHRGYTQAKIEELVTANGGKFSVDASTLTHLVSTAADVKKGSAKVKAAQQKSVHIVTLAWLTDSIESGKKGDEASYALSAPAPAAAPAASGRPKRKAAAATAKNESDDEPEPPAKKAKTAVAKKAPTKAPAKAPAKAAAKAPAKAKGKAKPKAKIETDDDAEMEDAEDAQADAKDDTPPPAPQMKTVIKKGKAPVDELCPLANTHHVYVDASGAAWDATLNQTDIGRNNNKFYYCQLLERDQTPHTYAVFCRWGRVGDRGQNKMYTSNVPLTSAMAVFDKQMKAKTGCSWASRHNALGGGKKYAYLERNYDEDDDEEDEPAHNKASGSGDKKDEDSKPPPKPTIAKPLVKLMELIFNSSFMQNTMSSMSYDSNKLPLGKLSKDTILRGFNLLKQIGEVIGDPANAVANFGEYGNNQPEILRQLSSRYYTVIPHNFGRNVPPSINNQDLLKREAELVENLIDMKIGTEILNASTKNHGDAHPVDVQYKSLALDEATPLDKASKEFKFLESYVKKTHGHTHHSNIKVEEIFRIRRESEEKRWNDAGWAGYQSDNRKLLWHGSRTTNFSGILSQGLRIAPPEAPVTGYMFDKGIYLADVVSKSANYCWPHLSDNTGLLLLCEAQLGTPMYESQDSDYYAAKTSRNMGAIATKGLGRTTPAEWECASVIHKDLEGVKVPKLSGSEANITRDENTPGLCLQYNEYIVYDISQVKLRYLFRVKVT